MECASEATGTHSGAKPAAVALLFSCVDSGRQPASVAQARQTHRVMDPTTFLGRLAALVPPPRHPLVRFHGVFAPHSSWRKKVVPAARAESSRCVAGSADVRSVPPAEPVGDQPGAAQGRDAGAGQPAVQGAAADEAAAASGALLVAYSCAMAATPPLDVAGPNGR